MKTCFSNKVRRWVLSLQRLGRMKRQGNMNEKVHEYVYVTKDTFDAYRFQTLEMKQGYISQIMSNSNPLRSCEDVSGEEMGFAAVKAACVGDPRIKEKMELDISVNELQVLKKGYLNSRYKLEDSVKIHLPNRISETKQALDNIKIDIETAAKYPKKVDDEGKVHFYGMTINGKHYTDKEQAAKELRSAITKALSGGVKKRIPIGEYKGFKLETYCDACDMKIRVGICGENKYPVTIGESDEGNLQRIDNKINALPEISVDYKVKHEAIVKELEDAKAQLEVPFSREQELQEKQARLDYLNAELAKDDKDNMLGEDNDKSFELATEEEVRAAEEREKARSQRETDDDFDISDY